MSSSYVLRFLVFCINFSLFLLGLWYELLSFCYVADVLMLLRAFKATAPGMGWSIGSRWHKLIVAILILLLEIATKLAQSMNCLLKILMNE